MAIKLTHIFLLILACAATSVVQAQQPAANAREGVLSVKFSPGAAAVLELSTDVQGVIRTTNDQGIAVTRIAAVNRLNVAFGAARIARIFRPAGRFEARHRRFGLHRWYQIEFADGAVPTTTQLQEAANAYAAISSVSAAELQHETRITDGYTPEARYIPEASARQQELSSPPAPEDDPPRSPETYVPGSARTVAANSSANDPYYARQWHYSNGGQHPPGTPDADIDLPEAHALETGHESVIVSIHDEGVQVDHEDLSANMWVNSGEVRGNGVDDDNNGYVDDVHGYNFVEDEGEIVPGHHGTHVAGIIGAVNNNGTGVAGIAGGDGSRGTGVRLMSMQIFSGLSAGGFAESYVYAADMGAVISQNSWGFVEAGAYDQVILDAIEYFRTTAGAAPDAPLQGGVVVFAAGNDNRDERWYPAYHEPAISVASTGVEDKRSAFSNFGNWVDIAAPGGNGMPYDSNDIYSTVVDGYGYLAGTSMACPHVSGIAALVVSAFPGMTSGEVRTVLEVTTDDISGANPEYEGKLGTGRVNAHSALAGFDPADHAPPGEITDLSAVTDDGGARIALSWMAPADDAGNASSGPVFRYEIAYSANGPIKDSLDFAAAEQVHTFVRPAPPGSAQTAYIDEMDFGMRYWFAVRAVDNNSNATLSNSPSASTYPAPARRYAPDSLRAIVESDGTTTSSVSLSNSGPSGSQLEFAFPAFAAVDLLDATPRTEHNERMRPVASQRHVKGADHLRNAGYPIRLGAGGPDDAGYTWIDSNEPGGPQFDWFDITDVGTELPLKEDDTASVALPFSFPFYGQLRSAITIGSNGILAFEAEGATNYQNAPIPDANRPNAIVAPFWDDLSPQEDRGTIHYYHDDAKNRFIVQYTDVQPFLIEALSETYTFQVMLDANGSIHFQYLDVENGAPLDGATVGIENFEGDDGLQVAFNTSYVEDSLAIAIANIPSFITDVEPSHGYVEGGSRVDVAVTFSGSDTAPGTYARDLLLATNDPHASLSRIPASLEIVEPLRVTLVPGPDSTRSVHPGQEFLVPITFGSSQRLTAEGFAFTLAFDEALLDPIGISTGGTLSEGYGVTMDSEAPGELNIAAAARIGSVGQSKKPHAAAAARGTDAAAASTGADTLLSLRFLANPVLSTGSLKISDFSFAGGYSSTAVGSTSVSVTSFAGDVGLNADVDESDAIGILQYVVGSEELSDVARKAADVSAGGGIRAYDASLVLQYISQKRSCFPAAGGCVQDSSVGSVQRRESSDAESAPLIRVPLELEGEGSISAFEITTHLDLSLATLETVHGSLPKEWHLIYRITDEGKLTIAAAGPQPLIEPPVITLGLSWHAGRQSSGITASSFSLGGTFVIDEGQPRQLTPKEVRPVPETFSLVGSYPNPFRGEAAVVIDLPKPADVTITVYDVLGRQVRAVERKGIAAGVGREIRLNARGLSSGVYFYRVVADTGRPDADEDSDEESGEMHAATGRMTLIR